MLVHGFICVGLNSEFIGIQMDLFEWFECRKGKGKEKRRERRAAGPAQNPSLFSLSGLPSPPPPAWATAGPSPFPLSAGPFPLLFPQPKLFPEAQHPPLVPFSRVGRAPVHFSCPQPDRVSPTSSLSLTIGSYPSAPVLPSSSSPGYRPRPARRDLRWPFSRASPRLPFSP
jgi:hypothetical protein